jgi:ribonuclease P protein component
VRQGVSSRLILEIGLVDDEAYVSTQQPQAEQDARVPCEDADDGRPERAQAQAREGAQAIGRVKGLSRARFEEVYSKGKRASGENLRIHALPGAGLIGIATSRRIGNRPMRNRQKRRAMEAVKGMDLNGLDIAVTVKPSAGAKSLDELRDELRNLVMEIRARWADGSASD